MAENKKNGKVTIKSIAEYCGVSVCTVSTVLQNRYKKRRITMPTVEKIRKAALELGYFPDIRARSLRIGDSEKMPLILALLTSYEAPLNITNHFLYSLRDAVKNNESLNARYDISISIEMFPAGRLSEMASIVSGNCFNAAIITNTTAEDDEFLKNNRLPFPVVLIDREIEGYTGVIASDTLARSAVSVLKSAGRKRLGILCGTPLTQSTRRRLANFCESKDCEVFKISASGLSEGAGYMAMRQFFALGGKIDGLYTVSDSLAMGAYLAIKNSGFKIPSDISVVGTGDYSYSEYFDPPLTTVGAKYSEFSDTASALLLSMISAGVKNPRNVSIGELKVIRDSV